MSVLRKKVLEKNFNGEKNGDFMAGKYILNVWYIFLRRRKTGENRQKSGKFFREKLSAKSREKL